MAFEPHPGGGGPGWVEFTGKIEARFGQQMKRPVWLKPFATADLPTLAEMGANEGALAYDDTLNLPTYYTGAAWAPLAAYNANIASLATCSQGDLIYGSASNTWSKLSKNTTATRYLSNTGTSNNPAWAQVNVANGVTGTLPVGNGGTGITSLGTGVASALGVNVGSAGAFLTFNGALGTPSSGTLTNCSGLPNASVVGLGTAALQNTGTSGANVPLLNGANSWSAQNTFTTSVIASGGGGIGYVFDRTTGATDLWGFYADSGIINLFQGGAGANRVSVSTTGLDVNGEARCDSLRIDASPSASAAGTTHKLAVNLNGTTYYILLSNV
ncbi:MAG: hypothetical protein ACEQSH_00970 [Bacteroidia bacterium]